MSRGCKHGPFSDEMRGSAEEAMTTNNRIFISNRQHIYLSVTQSQDILSVMCRLVFISCLPFRSDYNSLFFTSSLAMKSLFEREDLMTILDGIDDAVVKLDGEARFAAMNKSAARLYQRSGLDFF